MVADLGFGLPPGMAVRTSLVATALARSADLGEDDVRDAFYTALLLHVGCVAVAHESAAAFGDDIALNRAVARTNLADPERHRGDVCARGDAGDGTEHGRPGAGLRPVPGGVRVGVSHRHRGVRGGP